MPYFTKSQSKIERGAKILADIFVAFVILVGSIVCFGTLGGLLSFLILESCLIAVDYLIPSSDDETPGGAIR
jgi:hypothetical protein